MSARLEPSGEPPAKRQKLQPEITRSPNFWMKKGDFVLIASQKVAYRLHGDVLGRKSRVFNDLLNLDDVPRPDFEDMMDGCPVVHITDSPDDFNVFLGLVYDGFEHLRQHVEKPRWATVRVMILLGDKYDVPEMREEGLKQLRGWYADDIDEWDKRDRRFFARRTDHLSVVQVTRTINEPKLHAAVLYHCCRLPSSQLVLGDTDTGSPPLCADDLVCTLNCVRAMPQAHLDTVEAVFKPVTIKHSACNKCREVSSWRDIRTTVDNITKTNFEWYSCRILELPSWTHISTAVKAIICEDCFLLYKSHLRDARQSYRDKLVKYANL